MASLYPGIERVSDKLENWVQVHRRNIKDEKYKCVYPFEEQSKGQYQISELESERTGIGVTSSESKIFSPDCEIETETEDDGDIVEVRYV